MDTDGANDLQHTIKTFVRRGDTHYVAECHEIAVVTQGRTLDELLINLQEAVALHLQDEDVSEYGLGHFGFQEIRRRGNTLHSRE